MRKLIASIAAVIIIALGLPTGAFAQIAPGGKILGGACTNSEMTAISVQGVPTCTSNPVLTAGTGTGTFKPVGNLCQNQTNIVDASVQSQWNVATCSLPASFLATNGDTLYIHIAWTTANNGNTKGNQVYFALASATCSGSTGSLCNTGCQLSGSLGTALAASNVDYFIWVVRTSAGNQKYYGYSHAGAFVFATFFGTCTVDETQLTQVALGVDNTSAAAASVTASSVSMEYFSK